MTDYWSALLNGALATAELWVAIKLIAAGRIVALPITIAALALAAYCFYRAMEDLTR